MSTMDDDAIFTRDFSKLAAFPTFSLGAPSGLTPTKNVVFAGIGGITNPPGRKNVDGAASIGMGTGIPSLGLGMAATIDLGSINPTDGGALNRGDLGLAFGKTFDNYGLGMAVGVKNLTLWQGGAGRNDPSFYAAVTKIYSSNNILIILNGGAGSNAFRTVRDTVYTSKRNTKVSGFGSIAIYPLPQLSLVADYTAGAMSAGVGIVPIASWPVSLSFGVYDINKAAPRHTKTAFIGSLSVSSPF